MNKIKKARLAADLGQKEIADLVGVSQPTVSAWELGVKTPGMENYKKLAEIFHTTVDYLIADDDPTPPNKKRPVVDDEAWELMKEMHERPELRALFSTTRNVKKEDIEAVDKLLRHMAGVDEDDD